MKASIVVGTALVLAVVCSLLGSELAEKRGDRVQESKENFAVSAEKMVAAYEQSVARVIEVIADKQKRETDRPSVIAAIEVAGRLRVKEAVPHLTELLLYGRKGNIADSEELSKIPAPPPKRAPAVQALIRIGMPSVEPAFEKWIRISATTKNRNTLGLHCLWIIKDVLGVDLAKAYMLMRQKDFPDKKEAFAEAMNFLDVFSKTKQK